MEEEEAGAARRQECGDVCGGGWVGVDVFEVPRSLVSFESGIP